MRNVIFTALSYGVVLGALSLTPVYAANAQDTPCVSKSRVDDLAALVDTPGDRSPEAIRAELFIRKELLTQTIDCALAEVNGLASALRAIPSQPVEAEVIRSHSLSELMSAVSYYEFQRTKIAGLGLWGSRDFARELRDWRRNTYAPAAVSAFNFILWAKNQSLFKAAEARLEQVRQTVNALKITENEEIERNFTEAQTSFTAARAAHDSAQQALRSFDGSDDPLPFIQRSLEALSSSYKSLLAISSLVKRPSP